MEALRRARKWSAAPAPHPAQRRMHRRSRVLVSAWIRPQAGPVVAVGGAAIDRTPAPVKDWAIRHFGTNDKLVLQLGDPPPHWPCARSFWAPPTCGTGAAAPSKFCCWG